MWRNIILKAVAALALFLALAHLTGCQFHYHEPPQAGQESTTDDGGDWVRYLDLFAQWAMAVGAFLLFWLTLRTLQHAEKTAEHAIEQARRANVQATRSVDVLIDAERGKLHFHGGTIGRTAHVGWRVKNIGKTSIVVTQWGVEQTLMEIQGTFPEKLKRPERIGMFNYHMDPGGYLANFDDPAVGVTRSHIAWVDRPSLTIDDLRTKLGETHVLFVQMWARYTTAFGIDYIFREVMLYDGAGISHLWQYSEDRPHMFMGQFASTVLDMEGDGEPRTNPHLAD